MSEMENPVDTIVRLLSKNMRVVNEDGSLTSIYVSREWFDRELFKNYDGIVTVGLAESRDLKIEISGKLRFRQSTLRVDVWSQNVLVRQKIVEEINRVVRQNRNKPNETFYDFVGIGQFAGNHKAYNAGSANELSPESANWNELEDLDYQKVWYSDDSRYSKSHNINGEYALMLFRFKVDPREKTVKKIVLTFEGFGAAPNGNGVTMKVWNHVTKEWQHAQNGTGENDEMVTVTLTSNLTDYIDDNGYVWLLTRTTNPSNGSTAASINCDFVSCAVTVNGITRLDVVSFGDVDRVDVKPFIYRTEFTLKSWSFENLGV